MLHQLIQQLLSSCNFRSEFNEDTLCFLRFFWIVFFFIIQGIYVRSSNIWWAMIFNHSNKNRQCHCVDNSLTSVLLGRDWWLSTLSTYDFRILFKMLFIFIVFYLYPIFIEIENSYSRLIFKRNFKKYCQTV